MFKKFLIDFFLKTKIFFKSFINKRFIKFLIILIIIILLILGIGLGNYYYQISTPLQKISEQKEFIIKKGEGVNQISQNLKNQKLIGSMWNFEVYVWFEKMGKKFQAGEYSLSSNMNIKEITQILCSGQIIPNQKIIKIIEGWNYKEIGEYLENKINIPKEDFFSAAYDLQWKNKYSFLEGNFLEGYLFPDTYQVYKNATAEDIIKKMLDNFDKKLSLKIREDIKAQGKTIFEIITLASIIEKEVPKEEDRKIVAGIFYKRLKQEMRLESCATINYILGNDKKQLSFEDTRIESPYNTYINNGLPPGPINNPGLSAIKAAIYPEKTDYLFFLSKPTGETVFSKTLDEHNKNKAKWLSN
ncbi:endolytic transglycosylase MltG [Candidatus Kuenenbacteria bacterium]|nr:endolytic transglycosylase MltG [Candidatus Kuenenbacteria bacterium]